MSATEHWYHGSPLLLSELRPGSSISRNRDLARVFSHGPTTVSLVDDGTLRHDGRSPGYLYVVAEPLRADDLRPVASSDMAADDQWLTTRTLQLQLIEHTQPRPSEALEGVEHLAPPNAHPLAELAEALAQVQTVLAPDQDTPEWWAGAPSVARGADGTFFLAARMREGRSPRGRVADDGRAFDPIAHLTREGAAVLGFERPALVRDPQTGRFRLYGCAGYERGWAILRFDDVDHPSQFDARSARRVLWADYPDDGFAHVTGYKDPVVYWDGRVWQMFVIACDRVERIARFWSEDGEVWKPAPPEPILENTGWHNFYTRPACVLPLAIGCLFVYEGSHLSWRDPVYNIATGLAYTPDLRTFYDLTPDQPLLRSTTPGDYFTWRYSHWLAVGAQIYVYFEAARPNNSNEVRLAVLDSSALWPRP